RPEAAEPGCFRLSFGGVGPDLKAPARETTMSTCVHCNSVLSSEELQEGTCAHCRRRITEDPRQQHLSGATRTMSSTTATLDVEGAVEQRGVGATLDMPSAVGAAESQATLDTASSEALCPSPSNGGAPHRPTSKTTLDEAHSPTID